MAMHFTILAAVASAIATLAIASTIPTDEAVLEFGEEGSEREGTAHISARNRDRLLRLPLNGGHRLFDMPPC